MPWYYKFSGLWFGQASSLLFWSFTLSIITAFVTNLADKHFSSTYAAIVALVLTVGLVFYLAPVVFITNPFERLWQLSDGSMLEAIFGPTGSSLIVPIDGQGMNPSLRHPAMLLHPPALYIGLVGFFIPFVFALGALVSGDKKHDWIKKTYPLVVLAWIFLTAGMFLGSWWAYTILGWGGYWGWDAVEIAGLLPWLLSFGLIHSMQMQLRGKNFLRWIYLFSGLIVFFILAGILITRSGILESVHAYSTGIMGPMLSVLIVLNICPFIYFFFKRKMHLFSTEGSDSARLSEKLARLFNVFLIILVMIYFVGQTFPLTSQLFTDNTSKWTPKNYELISSPVLLAILFITAVFPLSDDKTGKPFSNLRFVIPLVIVSALVPVYLLLETPIGLYGAFGFWITGCLILAWLGKLGKELSACNPFALKINSFGMVLIHLGLGCAALGILGSENLSSQHNVLIEVGEQVEVDGLTLLSGSREFQTNEMGTDIYFFNITVKGTDRVKPIILTPQLEYFPKIKTMYARPAIYSNFTSDVQLILNEWGSVSGSTSIRVNIQPLMLWLWIGGLVMSLGGVIILVTGKKSHPTYTK